MPPHRPTRSCRSAFSRPLLSAQHLCCWRFGADNRRCAYKCSLDFCIRRELPARQSEWPIKGCLIQSRHAGPSASPWPDRSESERSARRLRKHSTPCMGALRCGNSIRPMTASGQSRHTNTASGLSGCPLPPENGQLEPISKSFEEDNEAGKLDKAEEIVGVVLP